MSYLFFLTLYLAETSSSTVVFAQQQPTLVAVQLFRETPVRVTCQYCGSDVFTSTMFETGTITWLACAITAFVGYVSVTLLIYSNTILEQCMSLQIASPKQLTLFTTLSNLIV